MSEKATPESQLKRFLYISTEDTNFITGDPGIHGCYKPAKLTCVSELLEEDLAKNFLTNLFVAAENEPLLPRREALFFAAVCFVTHAKANDCQRHAFYTLVLNMCRNNEDLFTFVKFLSQIKKPCSSGLQKIVSAYYLRQDPFDLIKCVTESNSYHGWTHKDLLKLIHCKTNNQAIEVIIRYILYGEKKAIDTAGEDVESLKIIEYIQKVKEFKTCNDENKVSQFIPELNIKRVSQIPSSLMKSQMVWAALIPQLSISHLITSLPKLYKMGFLKAGPIQKMIVDIFCNNEIIKSSKIHPVEVYIGMKNLEKGGKPRDPHLIKYLESKEDVEAKLLADPDYRQPDFAYQEPAKCTGVVNALHKTLTTSYANLNSVSKRFLITINLNEKMDEPCLTTRNVTCLEAAMVVSYSIFKANRYVTIAVFKGNTITPIQIDRNSTFLYFQSKMYEAKRSAGMLSAPFIWAGNCKKAFDVFIHISTMISGGCASFRADPEKDKPVEAFNNYMKKMNLPYTKLITWSLNIHNAGIAAGATNMIDICGFDKNVPNIIDAFSKNLF